MMYNDNPPARKISVSQRLLRHVFVTVLWSLGIGDRLYSVISGSLLEATVDSFLMSALVVHGLTAVKYYVTLRLMQKLVYCSAEKPEYTIKPLLICMVVRDVVCSLPSYVFSFTDLGGFRESLLAVFSAMGVIPQVILYIAWGVLTWVCVLVCWRNARLNDRRPDTKVLCVQVGLLSLLYGLLYWGGNALWLLRAQSTFVQVLLMLPEGIAKLLALWHGVFRDSMDTAIPGNQPVQEELPELHCSDPVREVKPFRSLFGRQDFSDVERVIAQSSRDAIRVMEHNELEMKHEWHCDDDQKERSK